MFRRWLPLWLVVCLLVSQAALARHIVAHTAVALGISAARAQLDNALDNAFEASAGSPRADQHASPHDDGVCEECLAFIAVDVALTSVPAITPMAAVREWHYPPAPPVRVRSISPGPTRNRDPPAVSVLSA
ncbi:hypothetical protein [Pandoraea sp. PE-S2R-1]|uniref:hypothetical protein n=1 Tax=Pandoraea sp. PE-S2R-1 TaxID=1986994 RepID=UPI000B4011A0|nr:hypothetical protein [Pandoraea sp. PE-S2R-1]